MGKRVLLQTRDLFFKAKLGAVVTAAGGEVVSDAAACDVAVVELGGASVEERIRAFVERGIPVLAFGSHVHAEVLRGARAAGAEAVPNSQVVETLTELLR